MRWYGPCDFVTSLDRGKRMSEIFVPGEFYGVGDPTRPPRAMIAPPKYIQGAGVLDHTAHYLGLLGYERYGILASRRGHGAEAGRVADGLTRAGGQAVAAVFDGECSLPEIEQHSAALSDAEVDCVIAVGGGKCVDAGKCVAERVGVPVVIVPTLASNDAPCSALSVVYTPEGVMNGAEFFPNNPVLVVVDTAVVASASARYLVAGMGDAMATWYEARVCAANPEGRNVLGTRPTMAACALGQLCASTLFEQGVQACADVHTGQVTQALDDVVEANTLLSGVGFESGGLAGAHGYAQGYTNVGHVEENFLHGEMVAMGVTAQLMMEKDPDEARRVATFFAQVGLPITLEQIGMHSDARADIEAVVEGAGSFAPFANLPFEVTPDKIRSGMLEGDALGRTVVASVGDAAYRRLQD